MTDEKIPEELAEMVQSGLLDDAWLEYLTTGKSSALAKYVELGGEIDDEMRQTIASHLRGEQHLSDTSGVHHANRSKYWEDYIVYSKVRDMMLSGNLGVMEACRELVLRQSNITENDQGFEAAVRQVYQQQMRGSKVETKDGPVFD